MDLIIPGWGEVSLQNLVLDYNGTIARDGIIPESVKELLKEIAKEWKIYILTADTYGSAANQTKDLPVELRTFSGGAAAEEKEKIVMELGGENCICFGNGRNDILMCKQAAVSVSILDKEGLHPKLLQETDILVRSMEEGLELLLNPKRIIADLRG